MFCKIITIKLCPNQENKQSLRQPSGRVRNIFMPSNAIDNNNQEEAILFHNSF